MIMDLTGNFTYMWPVNRYRVSRNPFTQARQHKEINCLNNYKHK